MRVCVDLDNVEEKKLQAVIERAHYLGFHSCEVFKTAHGFHLIFRGLKTNFSEVISLKRMLLDDPLHRELDAARGRQVLWTRKKGRSEKYLKTVSVKTAGSNANMQELRDKELQQLPTTRQTPRGLFYRGKKAKIVRVQFNRRGARHAEN